MKSRKLYAKYQKLWLDSSSGTTADPSDHLIEDLCLKLEMTQDFESYVSLLCDGMMFLIKTKISLKKLEKHKALNKKLDALSNEIISNSNKGSDLMYLGVFVELEMPGNKWSQKFYLLVKTLIQKILESGMKITQTMRHKLERLLEKINPELFKYINSMSEYTNLKSSA